MPPDAGSGVTSGDGPLIFLIAGEASADLHAARLMAALKRRTGGRIRFAGVGGERMRAEGLVSLFPLKELAVFGAAELLPKARRLLRRVRQTATTALAMKPDAMVTIDAPAFNFRVGRRIADRKFPLIHYIAPTVWAWREGRARHVARFLDHLIVLFPFEPPYFEKVGLPCTFVGHPILESGADRGDGARFRARHGIAPDAPVVTVLPGSRRGEIKRMMADFEGAIEILARRHPGLVVAMPTVEVVASEVARRARSWAVPVIVTHGDDDKYDAFAASSVALSASGTVTLELVLARLPAVVAYKVNTTTYWLARALVRVKYIHMINILLGRPVIPEFVQGACTPENLAAAMAHLMDDPAAAEAQRRDALAAIRQFGVEGVVPSDRAADVVLGLIGQGRRHALANPGARPGDRA